MAVDGERLALAMHRAADRAVAGADINILTGYVIQRNAAIGGGQAQLLIGVKVLGDDLAIGTASVHTLTGINIMQLDPAIGGMHAGLAGDHVAKYHAGVRRAQGDALRAGNALHGDARVAAFGLHRAPVHLGQNHLDGRVIAAHDAVADVIDKLADAVQQSIQAEAVLHAGKAAGNRATAAFQRQRAVILMQLKDGVFLNAVAQQDFLGFLAAEYDALVFSRNAQAADIARGTADFLLLAFLGSAFPGRGGLHIGFAEHAGGDHLHRLHGVHRSLLGHARLHAVVQHFIIIRNNALQLLGLHAGKRLTQLLQKLLAGHASSLLINSYTFMTASHSCRKA